MRYILLVAILTLLIATPSINSVYSSLQQEYSIQNMGNILTQDGFADTIFFEYGAESNDLMTGWDEVRGNGWGGYGGIVEVSTTHARTGTKSLYIYQHPPPKGENDRRPSVKLYGKTHGLTEGYWSFWIYVDIHITEPNPEWGPNIGGLQVRFGPEDEYRYRWWYGNQWHISQTDKRLYFSLGWGALEDGIQFSDDAEATEDRWYLDETLLGYDMKDFQGEWVHLQQYFRIATGTGGILRAWFSAPDSGISPTLIAEKTGFCSDPRGYDGWYDDPIYHGECDFHSKCSGPYPNLGCRVYQDPDSFENWMWFDDVVGATGMVPETYGVPNK